MSRSTDDLTGQRFERLLVKGLAPFRTKEHERTWECLCDCGEIVYCTTCQLRKKGGKKSCGCLAKETAAKNGKKSALWGGDSKNPKYQRLYRAWVHMNSRCYNENDDDYYLYGKRSITVCEEWRTNWFAFKNWALSHGYEENLTIDRINVNGNYEPDNCRWATDIEQANNKRTNKLLSYHGEIDTLANWCRRLNLDYYRTKARLNTCGYSVEDAFELGKYELRT